MRTGGKAEKNFSQRAQKPGNAINSRIAANAMVKALKELFRNHLRWFAARKAFLITSIAGFSS